jgi:MFS transporter, MFS domain-containing protein family, molybdate-anion transporter
MIMSDWLQGPYVYALYDHYGFTKGEIGQLFIVGFGSSLIFGTFVGGLADKYGRKLNCLIFALLYGISCLTKHFNNFTILLIGRLLGGVATSILMSAFETWMIHEHKARAFPDDWMSNTFAHITFGSSVVAIAAGLVASIVAYLFGFVAPFDTSLVLLCIGAYFIQTQWKENYGEAAPLTASTNGGMFDFDNFTKAWRIIVSNEKIWLLGLIQSAFEAAMYIFVFMWTPALEASAKLSEESAGASSPLPHGLIFAIFMVCIMIGSKVFEVVIAQRPAEHLARWVFVASAASLAVPILSSSHTLQLLAFCVFELCCGLYFPSVGTMRSRYIPEEVRSTVMNIFRVGLNGIVVIVLFNIDSMAQDTVFLFTVFLLTGATLLMHRLFVLSEQNSPAEVRAKAGLDPGEEMDNILESKTDVSA